MASTVIGAVSLGVAGCCVGLAFEEPWPHPGPSDGAGLLILFGLAVGLVAGTLPGAAAGGIWCWRSRYPRPPGSDG